MLSLLQTCSLSVNTSLPLVCLGSLLSFLCGVGIGANDLSANFAMVVGSGALNMRSAIICCVVFELLGAAIMGGHVSNTIRKGIVDAALFDVNHDLTVIGMVCASSAAALWLYLSTMYGLPVSITHTTVGSIVGYAVAVSGFTYIQGAGILVIVLSWLAAPLASFVVTAVIFAYLRSYVVGVRYTSLQTTRDAIPFCLAFSLLVDYFFILIEQPPIVTQTLAVYLSPALQYVLLLLMVLAFCVACDRYWVPCLMIEAESMAVAVWESRIIRSAPIPPSDTEPVILSNNSTLAGGAAAAGGGVSASPIPIPMPMAPMSPLHTAVVRIACPHGPACHACDDSGEQQQHHSNTSEVGSLTNMSSFCQPPTSLRASFASPTVRFGSPIPITLDYGASQGGGVSGRLPAVEEGTMPVEEEATTTTSPLSSDEEGWGMEHRVQPLVFGEQQVRPFNPRAEYLFTGLQVIAGSISSFVHGAVAGANATAAFVILYDAFAESVLGEPDLALRWSVVPAMAGLAVGATSLGARLMTTVGVELVTLTPARGWAIQVGATLTTMVLTGIGIPVSLSQSQIGSAVGCGVMDAGLKGVTWKLIIKIVVGWVVTLFISALTTGILFYVTAFFLC